jgi:hypothetical protein
MIKRFGSILDFKGRSQMLLLGIFTLLAGMVLGQRFRVLTLIPIGLLVLLLASGAGAALGKTLWQISLNAVVATACIQLGYLFGLGVRHVLLISRARRLRAASFESSSPSRRPAH